MKTVNLSIKIILLLFIVSCSSLKKTPLTEEQKLTQEFTADLGVYSAAYNAQNWEGVMDKIYPKLFDFLPKEKMVEAFNGMKESGLEMELGMPTVTNVSEVFTHEKENFCKVDYTGEITMKLSGSMLEMKDMLISTFKKSFGEENVSFDEKTNTLLVNSIKSMITVSSLDKNDWKFVEYNKDKPRMLKKIVPKEVLQKLTPDLKFEVEPLQIEQIEEVREYEDVEIMEEEDVIMEMPEEREMPKVEQIFTVVEKNPMFPGGETKLYEFLGDNIIYPKEAKSKGIEGKVYAQFVIEKDGSLTDIKILRGIGSGCDEEAIRVIKSMPNWIPGEQRGKKVRMRFVIPIAYKMHSDNDTENIDFKNVPPPPPPPPSRDMEVDDYEPTISEPRAFSVVEQMPEFSGGENKLHDFISENLQYPSQAIDNRVKGKVYVQFIVEKNGSLSNIKVIRGIGSGCDEEAIRVVKSMPNWIPGEQRSKKVRVKFNLPIKFFLR